MPEATRGTPPYGGTALVTGGGSGLGVEMSRVLVSMGYDVVITGRNEEALRATAAELGDRVRPEVCDVSDAEQVDALRDRLSGVEVAVLVNNAGVGGPVAPLVDLTPQEWDEVFAINVRGVYLMCRAFAPGMSERGSGFILNIASVTGKRPLENRTPYAASKMAVIGLSQTLAFELGRHGVMVNTLSPGPVVSERMDRNFEREAARSGITVEQAEEAFVSRAALRRMVTKAEVAQAVRACLLIPGLTGSDIDMSAGMIA